MVGRAEVLVLQGRVAVFIQSPSLDAWPNYDDAVERDAEVISDLIRVCPMVSLAQLEAADYQMTAREPY